MGPPPIFPNHGLFIISRGQHYRFYLHFWGYLQPFKVTKLLDANMSMSRSFPPDADPIRKKMVAVTVTWPYQVVQKSPSNRQGNKLGFLEKNPTIFPSPYRPWDWDIYLHENHKNQPNVGKYTSSMDSMGSMDIQWLANFGYHGYHAVQLEDRSIDFSHSWIGI